MITNLNNQNTDKLTLKLNPIRRNVCPKKILYKTIKRPETLHITSWVSPTSLKKSSRFFSVKNDEHE